MTTPAKALFDSLSSFTSVQDLIDAGQAEGQYLECKAPHAPVLDKGLKVHLADCLSGFANAGGGVIIWGVSTDSHTHSGLDVLTQIEPIGNCRMFAQRIDRTIPTLTLPSVTCPASTILLAKDGDSKGLVISYVPGTEGDPVQTIEKNQFLLRIGAALKEMPYETIKRMFAGTNTPDLMPVFDARLVKREQNGTWSVPILVQNVASAATEHATIWVEVMNHDACDNIACTSLQDASAINPGRRLFTAEVTRPLYRGPRTVIGYLQVMMKKGKRPKRILSLQIELYANRMRARRYSMRVQLAKKGFSVKATGHSYLY